METAVAHDVHWNMLSANGPLAGHSGVTAFYDYGGQLDLLLALYDTNGNVHTDCGAHSAKSLPIGKWACYAWAQKGPTNEMQLFDESGEIADMHIVNKGGSCLSNDLDGVWTAPTFTTAKVGLEMVQQDISRTMYIDDVTFDDQPLSCP